MSIDENLFKVIQKEFPRADWVALVDLHGSIAYPMIEVFNGLLHKKSANYDDGKIPKLLLILDTDGGNLSASRAIAKLIKQYCLSYEAVVVKRAMSSGTLLALAADKIWMTPEAVLGPIDPTITNFSSQSKQLPVSVEDLRIFFSDVQTSVSVKEEAITKIIRTYDPIVLGQALRARKQIRMTAREFLENKLPESQLNNTLDLLIGGWGTHGNPITREDAKDVFHLPIDYIEESAACELRKLLTIYRGKLSDINDFEIVEKMKEVGVGQSKNISVRPVLIASEKGNIDSWVLTRKFCKIGSGDLAIQFIGSEDNWETMS